MSSLFLRVDAASHRVESIHSGPIASACDRIDSATTTETAVVLALLVLAVTCVDWLRRRLYAARSK